MEKTQHIVILAAGDFPTHPVPLRALREADFVVCCDSAYTRFSIFNFQFSIPFIVIGDGDSLPEEEKRRLGDRWIQVDEQDYNDLHKAMQWVINEELRIKNEESKGAAADSSFFTLHSSLHIMLLGATGRREDHTLGNISYLVTFAEEYPGADIEMLTDHGRFCTFSGTRTFEAFPHQQVSIFTLDPATAVSSEGLRWPLDRFRPTRWWQATLNDVLADTFTLTADGPVILFRTYAPKA